MLEGIYRFFSFNFFALLKLVLVVLCDFLGWRTVCAKKNRLLNLGARTVIVKTYY